MHTMSHYRKLVEGLLNNADVADVFKAASEIKRDRRGRFNPFKKKGVSIQDLQQAWTDAGHPTDSNSVAKVLSGLGFGRKEINKVFKANFGTTHGKYDTENSAAVQRIAKFVMENDYTEEILHFLNTQYDYNDEEDKDKKVTTEQIRAVFECIIREERSELPRMQKEFDQQSLGRHRK
jgi:hypothetical protein